MPKAVALVRGALKNKEKILLFGDYDVDGITGLAVLKKALNRLGADCQHYIPHRIHEGYGLNRNVLQLASAKGIRLLITVDCGTNSHKEIRALRAQGIEVIVSDHHEAADDELPPASAVLNPKLKASGYKFRDLAGVGVAYKLAQAVTGEKLQESLDLVCLGTIADVVPLSGENRVIAKEGLARIACSKNLGLQALFKTSGLRSKRMNSNFVGFILGPRINASGRMDRAELSLELLLSDDEQEALRLAGIIEGHNRARQKIEATMLQEAEDLIAKEVNFKEQMVVVLAKDNWHQGVLGIVASKLADRLYRPTILICKSKHLCKGSGRSIKNFHLFRALGACRDLLESFGGHDHAAGLRISSENIPRFRDKINHLAREQLFIADLLPTVEAEMELDLSDLSEKLISELEGLEPFGSGNPEPLFYTSGLRLKASPQGLSRETLKFWLTDGRLTCEAIAFGMADLKEELRDASFLDVVYTPKLDCWNGQQGIILEVKDIFPQRRP
jgi:single-stranded-DNA-specific exonuclease